MTPAPQGRAAASTPPAGPPPAAAGAAVAKPGTPRSPVRDVPGPAPQRWTLEIPPGTTLRTSNDRLHPREAAKLNKALRVLGCELARAGRIPRIARRADVYTTYLPPPRLRKDRHPLASVRVEDAGALYPSTKSLVDGVTDFGVWAADNFRHVRREIYELLEGTCPRGQMKVHIIEVPS